VGANGVEIVLRQYQHRRLVTRVLDLKFTELHNPSCCLAPRCATF
jgi:hypothetical protein